MDFLYIFPNYSLALSIKQLILIQFNLIGHQVL